MSYGSGSIRISTHALIRGALTRALLSASRHLTAAELASDRELRRLYTRDFQQINLALKELERVGIHTPAEQVHAGVEYVMAEAPAAADPFVAEHLVGRFGPNELPELEDVYEVPAV